MTEIEDLLTQFNINPQNRKLRDYYEADNLWRTLKIERDENSHSAFIAWLLGTETTKENSPLLNLLNLVVRRNENNVTKEEYAELKKSILLGTIKFRSVKITPEQVISKISKIRYNDRLDIFVNCNIEGVGCYEKLEIIIENKINSNEGKNKLKEIENPSDAEKKYIEKEQTKRYYYACSKEHNLRKDNFNNDNTLQLFIFLTPQDEKPSDNHFIKITYQDIVDYIIEPHLGRVDLDEHTIMVLKEYLRILGNPNNYQITMATTEEEKELLIEFYMRNEDLFKRALEVRRDNADSPEEADGYTAMLESMNNTRTARRRAFSINGEGSYKMYEVVAEFVKHLREKGISYDDIEKLIKNYTHEDNRCHISQDQTKVYRYLYKDKPHYYEAKHNEETFYVTKEWGLVSEKGNFGSFLPSVNEKYQEFQIKELDL